MWTEVELGGKLVDICLIQKIAYSDKLVLVKF